MKKIKDETERTKALEKQAILVSLENLMTFPFVKEAVDKGDLTLHGLWHDIGEGGVEQYNAGKNVFEAI